MRSLSHGQMEQKEVSVAIFKIPQINRTDSEELAAKLRSSYMYLVWGVYSSNYLFNYFLID